VFDFFKKKKYIKIVFKKFIILNLLKNIKNNIYFYIKILLKYIQISKHNTKQPRGKTIYKIEVITNNPLILN
jgi:hypothetical protein